MKKKSYKNDVRWIQRLNSLQKAFLDFDDACGKETYSKLERSGLIQTFEFTFELAWKTLQDLLAERGYADIVGPRPVLQQAFKDGLIQDGEVWMEMLKSRNLTAHLYEEGAAQQVAELIRKKYLKQIQRLLKTLEKEKQN